MSSPQIPDLQISLLRIVAHNIGPVSAGAILSYNHWSIFLLVPGGAVRINMSPLPAQSNDLTGKMLVKGLSYQLPNNAIRYWDFAVPETLRIRDVLGLIVSKGRRRYMMDVSGSGCRYWIYVVIRDLQGVGFVERQSTTGEMIEEFIRYNYSVGHAPYELAIKEGTFF